MGKVSSSRVALRTFIGEAMKTAAEMKAAVLAILAKRLEYAHREGQRKETDNDFDAAGWRCRERELLAVINEINPIHPTTDNKIEDEDLLEILNAGRRIVDITRELRDR